MESHQILVKINNWDSSQVDEDQKVSASHLHIPDLYNISAGLMYRFTPIPEVTLKPEFVYVDVRERHFSELVSRIAYWNMSWEAGQYRSHMHSSKSLPPELKWLTKVGDRNIYLVPNSSRSSYFAFSPLYHILPGHILDRFGLPKITRGIWPPYPANWANYCVMPPDFNVRLSEAFSNYIWPFLNRQSAIYSFSKDEPIVTLAHNLNYWLPYIYQVAENKLKTFGRVPFENEKQKNLLTKVKTTIPAGEGTLERPMRGGSIWSGEEEARKATDELIELADKGGSLRGIIDAVKSNRVKDDFSACWSYAREDFERKLYSKRSKCKIAFVELDEAPPVHNPESEIIDRLSWEHFTTFLNPKEKQIIVCLKNGETSIGQIAKDLGYANHSPISKALVKIRKKAKKYLDL